jgi:hydroxymethylpyrimidine pyrophosphatase-like HAD family hydrolase
MTLSNIRLIASDVDGTLTQNGKFSSDFISTLLDLQSAELKCYWWQVARLVGSVLW